MTNIATDVIKVLSKAFKDKFADFNGIYLFGTFLDGEEHDGEDIELVALLDAENKDKREELWRIVGKVETDLGVCIDLYPYTLDAFKQDKDLYNEVMKEGIFFDTLGTMKCKGKN